MNRPYFSLNLLPDFATHKTRQAKDDVSKPQINAGTFSFIAVNKRF